MKEPKQKKINRRYNKKNKMGKLPFLFLIIICLGFITYGVYYNNSEITELKKDTESTIGTIEKKYNIRSRGYYINYFYKVKGKRYKGSKKLNKAELEEVNVGDKFEVTYSVNSPKYNILSFENRIQK